MITHSFLRPIDAIIDVGSKSQLRATMNDQPTIHIFEVGPRDGLQNEPTPIPTALKLQFIQDLTAAGLTQIEATSFVSAKWVPQMSDHTEVMQQLSTTTDTQYYALTPNLKGATDALTAGASALSVFTTASETFSQKNTACSIADSLIRITEILNLAKEQNIPVRGYVSCVFGCPYEGDIEIKKVVKISQQLIAMGCQQVSLGDTIGIGTAGQAKTLINALSNSVPLSQIAIHFHDTYGQALANIYACLEAGITTIDSSAAGLGGCPYAPGASGNVATEDVLYMLQGLGVNTHVDIARVIAASRPILECLNQVNRSKAATALQRIST